MNLYDEALSGRTDVSVAEILRQLRAKYDRRQPVPSILAYVYYGNPFLRLASARTHCGSRRRSRRNPSERSRLMPDLNGGLNASISAAALC